MAQFKITTDSQKMSAFLNIQLVKSEEEEITTELALAKLNDAGVVFGVDEEAVKRMVEEKKWGEMVKVAAGKPGVIGKNGYVKFYFSISNINMPKEREDGSVDFHDLNIVQNVKKGQVLAELIPPTPGKPGSDVFGGPIPARSGRAERLNIGLNTSFKDEEKTIIVSNADGHVKRKTGNSIEVDTVYRVKGDVDFNTGDLDVNGDVIIDGDVRDGFTVKAAGNVDVRGTVEDATIIAGGIVTIRDGFVGKKKGLVKAEGDVIISFISNQKVESGGDISIVKESIQSDLKAKGSVLLNRGTGTLIGGSIVAGEKVEVKTLGSDQHITTKLTIGDISSHEGQLQGIKDDIAMNKEELKEAQQRLTTLMELKYSGGWTDEMGETQRRLEMKLVEIPRIIKKLERLLEFTINKIKEIKGKSILKVTGELYPGIDVRLAGFPRKISSKWGAMTFRIVNNEVIISRGA
jgi:hypothetical protein